MIIDSYSHFGGRTAESAAIRNLMAFAGVVHPETGKPLSEALCFGIAGGIGAGYSFCPSVPRYGGGSGVSVVGRHKSYATDASWYQGFCDRLGARTRITETSGTGKATQNLLAELEAGRPTVVWCSRAHLPFLGEPKDSCGLWMHSFVVYGIDEAAGVAYGADRAPTPVTISLERLAKARNGICSHKNRTLTLDPPAALTPDALRDAVRTGLWACVEELYLRPKLKTYSLPGLEIWAKMIDNDTNKDGWGKVFTAGLRYQALRDVFDSIETAGTGGGLYRGLFAEFLDEAALLLDDETLADLSCRYRDLGRQWTALGEAALPDTLPVLRRTRELLREKRRMFEDIGEPAAESAAKAVAELRAIEAAANDNPAFHDAEWHALRRDLRDRVLTLHVAETQAANCLRQTVGVS